ncbi:MAG: hypothetical protein ACYCV4_11630 [Dermatophilaceae bacterium]
MSPSDENTVIAFLTLSQDELDLRAQRPQCGIQSGEGVPLSD